MKKTIILTLLCALCMGAQAADYNYLVFTMNDNTTQTVAASNLTMSFGDGKLTVSNGTTTLATITLADLAKMEFSNTESTGITTISTDRLTIDETTQVYDLNGRQLPSGTQLQRGIYIVKTNGRTIKVQIR